jgi:hypothetical protein
MQRNFTRCLQVVCQSLVTAGVLQIWFLLCKQHASCIMCRDLRLLQSPTCAPQTHLQEHGCAIAAPQFDHTTFPTSIQFQLGNTTTAEGRLNAAQHWTFSCIEPLFNHILQHYPRVQASTYALYGHSAGAQFVTRFLFHVQPSRCSMALAANAGELS